MLIEVQGLRKVYDGRAVVDGVSFSVAEGEIFGILGPNGAGKTTAVECLAGLRRPDAGAIRVAGLDPHRDGPALRQVLGVQLQASRLQARLRVLEALELYATFYDDPLDPGELLDELGLTSKRHTGFGNLSGGQQQRLSIALALIGRPRIAILDELTTGLDPAARRETWQLIERVRDRGVTLLLVTHFMEEAQRLCDRLAIFDRGRVIATDTPAGLVARAGDEHRLRFLPSAPVDPGPIAALPEVTDVRIDGDAVLVAGNGAVVHAVLSHLGRDGVVPHELRVDQPSLDDAFVRLTGRPFDDEPAATAAEEHR